AITAMLVLGVPLASTAAVSSSGRQAIRHVGAGHKHTYISPGLLRLGAKFPHRKIHVIIQSDNSTPAAAAAFARVNRLDGDIANRVVASVNLSTRTPNSPGDGRGHGTFVAGIAAGGAPGYAGAVPNAKLVSIDVMDDNDVASTSDVIAACSWILANQDKYNIK